MLELRLLDRVREIPKATWDALVSEEASPFVEWTWLDCLEEAGCVGQDTGWIPTHFALYDGERLKAAMPAYAKTNSEGEFVFDFSWADASHRAGMPYYPKLVGAVPFTPATGDRLLVHPGDDRAEIVPAFALAMKKWISAVEASSAHVLFPREEEARLWSSAGFARRFGVQFHWHRRGEDTFDGFLARFNSKRRNQIKRECAQAAKDGVSIETLTPKGLTPDVVRAMFALYATNVDKHFYGRRYLNLRFFELVAERFAHRLAWVVAKKDGAIIASAFNVEKGSRLYGRYWGAHLELPFLHFNVCYYTGIRHCIERGLDVFEPGAGGEHKRVRGFDPTITHSAHWIAEPRLRAAIEGFLEREREAITAYVARGGED